MEANTTQEAFSDVTDDELLAAYDHAVGNTMQKPTSDEYRQWWTARAKGLLRELERRGVDDTGRGSS